MFWRVFLNVELNSCVIDLMHLSLFSIAAFRKKYGYDWLRTSFPNYRPFRAMNARVLYRLMNPSGRSTLQAWEGSPCTNLAWQWPSVTNVARSSGQVSNPLHSRTAMATLVASPFFYPQSERGMDRDPPPFPIHPSLVRETQSWSWDRDVVLFWSYRKSTT